MKWLRVPLFLVLSLIMALVLAEGVFRFCRAVALPWEYREVEEFTRKMNLRLYGIWTREAEPDPFVPPFKVFTDRNWDDDKHLREVFEATQMPPSQDWTTFDFLRPESLKEQTKYQVHSNSLGFRGHEVEKKKSPGTQRIIVLGDYHAFGQAVADDEAYPAVLERELNRAAPKGRHYEVWNGGRCASTAIVGLARLKNEILDYHPDLVILDYGFVDPLVWGDGLMMITLKLPKESYFQVLRPVVKWLSPILGRSVVVQKIQQKLFAGHFADYVKTTQATLEFTASHHIPVITVKQLENMVPPPQMAQTIGDRATIVDASMAFLNHPPGLKAFTNSKGRWVEEVDPGLWAEKTFNYWPYRQNIFQLSAEGHAVLAEALTPEVHKILDFRQKRD